MVSEGLSFPSEMCSPIQWLSRVNRSPNYIWGQRQWGAQACQVNSVMQGEIKCQVRWATWVTSGNEGLVILACVVVRKHLRGPGDICEVVANFLFNIPQNTTCKGQRRTANAFFAPHKHLWDKFIGSGIKSRRDSADSVCNESKKINALLKLLSLLYRWLTAAGSWQTTTVYPPLYLRVHGWQQGADCNRYIYTTVINENNGETLGKIMVCWWVR